MMSFHTFEPDLLEPFALDPRSKPCFWLASASWLMTGPEYRSALMVYWSSNGA